MAESQWRPQNEQNCSSTEALLALVPKGSWVPDIADMSSFNPHNNLLGTCTIVIPF